MEPVGSVPVVEPHRVEKLLTGLHIKSVAAVRDDLLNGFLPCERIGRLKCILVIIGDVVGGYLVVLGGGNSLQCSVVVLRDNGIALCVAYEYVGLQIIAEVDVVLPQKLHRFVNGCRLVKYEPYGDSLVH